MIVSNLSMVKNKRKRVRKMKKKTWFANRIGRIIAVLLVMNIFISLQAYAAVTRVRRSVTVQNNAGEVTAGQVSVEQPKELRGVWFSYIDWGEMPSDKEAFKQRADQVMADIKNRGMNAVFCHVHSHSDSYGQKLKSFPQSKFMVTKTSAPDFDPFEYMLESAHKQGLSFHAWVNPYRVTNSMMRDIPDGSIVKQWMADPAKQRNVLLHEGNYYLNPSSEEVRNYLVNSIREICQNYAVDGIQFDDYFYPSLNNNDPAKSFDKPEYDASGSNIGITQWRRNNVSILVKDVYKAVHEIRPQAVFGISPVALLSNLRSDRSYFVDIDTWMASNEYIDYIMPQLYHGFEAKTKTGILAPHAYINCLNSWIDLKRKSNSNVKLHIGLGLYRTGKDIKDGNAVSEWLRYNDILLRQVKAARETGEVSGFGIFAYQNFREAPAILELNNLQTAFTNQ